MKKIILTLGMIGLLTPFSIKALTGDVTVNCEKNKLSKEETTTCTVKGNITEEVSTVSAKVDLGENLTFVSFTPDSSWEGDGEEGNIELYTDTNKSGNFNIGVITIKAGNTAGVTTNVGLKEVKLSDASFAEHDFTVEPYSIRIPSDVNTLNDIKIGPRSIYMNSIAGFSSTKTDYELDVVTYQNSIIITPTLSDESATLSGDSGEKALSYGINNFKITVTSELGTTKEYNIKIKRPESRELTNLKINDEEINLEKGTHEYTYQVNNDITSAKIEASYISSLTEGYLRFVDGFGPRTVEDLKVGNNEILVKVADGFNEELVYKININRLDEKGKDVTDDKKNNIVSNPKTGVYGISIALIATSVVGYMIVKKKNLFKKKI